MNHHRKRYMGQGPKVSRAQEPLSLWSQDVPLSQHINLFTNQDALPNLITASSYQSIIT